MRLPFSGYVYAALWLIGVAGSFVHIRAYIDELVGRRTVAAAPETIEGFLSIAALPMDGQFGTMTGPIIFVLWVVYFANLIHQAFLYINLHDMEHNLQRWTEKFPNFINTKIELSLRIAAFLFLLVAAGKMMPLVEVAGDAEVELFNIKIKQLSFVAGSLLLFATLLIWDLIALIRSDDQLQNIFSKQNSVHLLYIATDSMAFLYWYIMAWGIITKNLPGWAMFVILIFVLCYIVFMVFRIKYQMTSDSHYTQTADTVSPPDETGGGDFAAASAPADDSESVV